MNTIPSFLDAAPGRTLAYDLVPAVDKALPMVVFLGGFRSDMLGTKAGFLKEDCRERGQGFLRFDYSGHGQSGGSFEEGTIGLWLEDALAVIDRLTEGPLILVGSSMGGWLALLVAKVRPHRIAGLIGLAAAPDFTAHIAEKMSPAQRAAMGKDGFFAVPNDYDVKPYVFTKALIDDGRRHFVLASPLDVAVPVHLIQGMKDADVSWDTPEKIKAVLPRAHVQIHLIEDGEHRLSRPEDLDLLKNCLAALNAQIL